MNEGWSGGDYLILFDQREIGPASDRYAISEWLPGYEVIGLRGWDDLIVRDSAGRTFTVPTVPAIPEYLCPFAVPATSETIAIDHRFHNSLKWYTQPIALGGDPSLDKNVIWVTHDQHAQLVKFWNHKYRSEMNKDESKKSLADELPK
jgi:hypothetical protein